MFANIWHRTMDVSVCLRAASSLQVYMASSDYAGLIDACARLGDASRGGDPQLWTVVLEHLTQQEEDVTEQVTA